MRPGRYAIQLQVLAIASLFLLYDCGSSGKFLYFISYTAIPSLLLNLIGLFVFIVEFLLFYFQRKDPSGIEYRYFDLLLVPITVWIFSTILDLKTPNSNFPKFYRGVGLILQGMWFLQMGLSFYTKNFVAHGCSLHQKSRGNYTIKCKGHPEYHRARAIATLHFFGFLYLYCLANLSIEMRSKWSSPSYTKVLKQNKIKKRLGNHLCRNILQHIKWVTQYCA